MSRSNVFIDEAAQVHTDAKIGKGTKIWNGTKVRENTQIGENSVVGQCCYIDTGVSIGDNCKIQNGVSIYDGVIVEDKVFIGPNATFTNDLYPRAHNSNWKITKTLVKKGASIGANATIICGVSLGENCMIGAGALVTKDIPAHALVVGQPARIVDFVTTDGHPLKWDMEKNGLPTSEQFAAKAADEK